MSIPAPQKLGETVHALPEPMQDFVRRLLIEHDLSEPDADTVARCLVRADLRGVETHGVMRLPGYLDRVRRKLINARPDIRINRVTPVAAHIDGDNGFGFVVATRAMAEAMNAARQYGIGVAAVKRSTHFGMAANYVLQAVESGYVALVFTNASPAMPPWGGREALIGTSPLAAGTPGGFVLDMAPSVAARGKIRRALRRGQQIPFGYALDGEGRPTTDPAKALQGVVLPIGGPKGSGIAIMMDVFSGVLSGAAFGGDVRDQYKDYQRPQNVGHFFMAMKSDLFVPLDEYRARMETLIGRVHASPPAEGFTEVLMPGEPEARREAERRRTGIPYAAADLTDLAKEAQRAGLHLPEFRSRAR